MVKNKNKLSLKPFKEIWAKIPVDPVNLEMEAAESWVKHIIEEAEGKLKSGEYMKNDLVFMLLDFIKKEKLHVVLKKVTDTKMWLETEDGAIAIEFIIDDVIHTLLFDIYSDYLTDHLKIETLRDLEKVINIEEERQDWKFVSDLEEIWLLLDEIKFWSYHNQFRIREIVLFA